MEGNAAAIESRYQAAVQAQRAKVRLAETNLGTLETQTRAARAELKKERAEFWKLVDRGPDPQQALDFTEAPTPAADQATAVVAPPAKLPTSRELLGDTPVAEPLTAAWRFRDVRELGFSIPIVNALYKVPLETIGALWDYFHNERSLLTAGGFSSSSNITIINGFRHARVYGDRFET